MNKQIYVPSKSTYDRLLYLLVTCLVATVMLLVMVALTAVSRPPATLAQGGGLICGHKFNDLNGDGVWDMASEPGLPNWVIQLDGGTGAVITVTTDASGHYCFDALADGQYTVSEVNQPDWQQTLPAPDPGGTSGVYQVNINGGQGGGDTFHFGNHMGRGDGGIHGTKFYDENNNQMWDSTEPGLGGWVIELEDANGNVLTTTTNQSGHYWFMGITTGTYTVTEQLPPPGWIQTFPPAPGYYVLSYVPSQAIENVNFGNYAQPGEIHGMKFHDQNGNGIKDTGEPGLPNWTIMLQGSGIPIAATTNITGEYWFMGLPPDDYIVSEVQPPPVWNGQFMLQWVQTAPISGTHAIELDPGEIVTDADFGNWQNGKNDFCMIPWDNHFLNTTSLTTEIYIFNASNNPQKAYTLQLVGPTTFTVTTPLPITLNPYQYGVVQIEVAYPSIFNAPYQSAQFQAVVTNQATNTSFTCHAALWSYSPQWWTFPNVNSGLAGGIPFGFTQNISFTVQNNGPGGGLHLPAGGGEATYKVWAMTRGITDTSAVSLNGLPPGAVITGTISNTPGQTDIPVSIRYTEFILLGPTDIILELDVTGDGMPDMVTSYLAYIEPPRLYLPVIVKP
ncbi:MAG: hypothetical protein KF770_24485 [Anaerolineae bacterium]|nr:hypothetical protein [Anaerolineae bacterium]